MIHHIKDFTKDVLEQDKWVLIDFWAAWCAPCSSFAPIFESASTQHPHILFYKVDVDKQSSIAQVYGISSIPTMLAFHQGKEIKRISGAMDQNSFENWIKDLNS